MLALLLVTTVAAMPAGAAARTPTCRSGKDRFRDGPIRIFRTGSAVKGTRVRWWICSAQLRRPTLFVRENEYIGDSRAHFRRQGARVAYWWQWDDGAGGGWTIGWVDSRTGRGRSVFYDYDDVSGDVHGAAIGADGSLAYLVVEEPYQAEPVQRVYLAVRKRRGLGRPRLVATVPGRDIDPASLTVEGREVRWTSTAPPADQPPEPPPV